MSDVPWFADEATQKVLAEIARTDTAKTVLRWQVRVDRKHPRRSEKAGDLIELDDGQVALAARHIWAGWTPGFVVEVTLTNGTRVIGPWTERLVCCDMHNRHCEPLSDLCCEYCSEAFHPKHALIPCVLSEVKADD